MTVPPWTRSCHRRPGRCRTRRRRVRRHRRATWHRVARSSSTTTTTMPLGAPSTSNSGSGSTTASTGATGTTRARQHDRDNQSDRAPDDRRDRDDRRGAGEHDDAGERHHATERPDGDNLADDHDDATEEGTDDLVRPAIRTMGLRRAQVGRGDRPAPAFPSPTTPPVRASWTTPSSASSGPPTSARAASPRRRTGDGSWKPADARHPIDHDLEGDSRSSPASPTCPESTRSAVLDPAHGSASAGAVVKYRTLVDDVARRLLHASLARRSRSPLNGVTAPTRASSRRTSRTSRLFDAASATARSRSRRRS